MQFNIPNTLTIFRIIAIPLIVFVFFLPVSWARPLSGCFFVLAGITDWLDGYLARRLGQTSKFGAFLDPVADKLIISTALVLLVQSDPQIIFSMIAVIIIGREIAVSALREWMAELGERGQVAVTFFGKWKTTVQMIGISLMLYQEDLFGVPTYTIGTAFMFVAAGLTLWSMIDYLRAAWPVMTKRD